MRAFEIQKTFGLEALTLVERPDPVPGPRQVLVGLHAVSLNYRDLLMVRGLYYPKQPLPLIPLSDGVGEVLAVGDGVTRVKSGHRVAPIFCQKWIAGAPTKSKLLSALGRAARRHARRADDPGRGRGRERPRPSLRRGGGDPALRGRDRLERARGAGRPARGGHPPRAGDGRGRDLRPAVREDAGGARDRDVQQRRQARAGEEPGRGRARELPDDAGLGPQGEGPDGGSGRRPRAGGGRGRNLPEIRARRSRRGADQPHRRPGGGHRRR